MTDFIRDPRDQYGCSHIVIDNSRHLALMLCQERINQGYGQSDVADAAGTTQSVVSDIERGKKSTMTVDTALRIAAALGFRLALVPFTAEDEKAVEEILSLESVVVPHDEEAGE